MKKFRMNVSLSFDDKYTKYAYITLMSLFINNPEADVYAYILQYDLSDESRNYLNALADSYDNHMIFLEIDPMAFDGMPTIKKWPIQVYFRLLLPDLLPEDIDRIIYFDSDMTINSSLQELYETDFEGNDLIGCYDLNLIGVDLETFLYYRHEALTPTFENKTYINSGMIMFNLDNFRKNYSLRTYLETASKLDNKIYAPDQDLINYVHMGKIRHVDPRKYNYPGYVAFLEGIRADKACLVPVMHFVCEKPWQGGNHAHFDTEMIWWNYAFKSPFRDEFVEKYIEDSCTDPTIMESLSGTDRIKNDLVSENARLKKELASAMDQVKKVISMLSK